MVWSVVAVQPNRDVRDQMYCAEFCWHTTDWSTTKHNDDDDDDDDYEDDDDDNNNYRRET